MVTSFRRNIVPSQQHQTANLWYEPLPGKTDQAQKREREVEKKQETI
jgi:hypothetical protein